MYSENILILTDWSYKDALIQVTLPYIAMKRKYLSSEKRIFFRTLEQDRLKTTPEEREAIREYFEPQNIKWIPNRYIKGVKSVPYSILTFFRLLYLCKKEKIGILHLYCTPPSILAYGLSLLTGARIILDSYEPHAEAMVENGTWSRKSVKFRLLFKFEKLISAKAELAISATRGMEEYAKKTYNVSFKKFYVKPACVNTDLFSFENRKKAELVKKYNLENKIVCVYAGKFGGIYLEEEVFSLLKIAHEYFGDPFRIVILTNHSRKEIEDYCQKVGLDPHIILSLFVSHKEIPDYMGLGDFALTPVKPVPTKRYCTPIKDGEYWALGLPVIITKNISDDSDIIEQHQIGAVIKEFNTDEYKNAVKKIDTLLKSSNIKELYDKIRIIAKKYRGFDIADHIYGEIYH